ncbi:hypothetical protein JXI42_00505, partial [bacterium]|nr:hypothetical protein [bacterium]
NPLTVYYFEQWNHRDYDDNLFIGLDFIYTHPPFPQVYGELMIDDFQIDFFSEPHEAGWKLGLNYAPHFFKDLFMNFEYARVSNWVYSQEEPQNYFIYYDEPIGFPLGCDVDRLKFSLKYQILKNLYSRVRYSYTRKGEGKIYRDFEGAVPETEFPSGLVDKTSQIAIGLTWKPVSWITANSYLDYSSITDLEHGLSEWSVCECDLKKYELGINLNLYY